MTITTLRSTRRASQFGVIGAMEALALLGGTPVRTQPFSMEVPQINDDDVAAVTECLRERRLSIFSSGRIAKFEEAFANFVGTRHAVALTSGTAALQTALVASEIGAGDEVIVPVYTYAATINAILLQGATPVFADIDTHSFVLPAGSAQIRKLVTSRTKAIVVVDLFGNPTPRQGILNLANECHLRLIEDCAQSTGAEVQGKAVGSFGIGCHSFGEIKNMTSAEGGMLTTDDENIARRARLMRHAGEVWRETHTTTIGSSPRRLTDMINGIDYELIGANFRMNALQAALGLSQLKRLSTFNKERVAIAEFYLSNMSRLEGIEFMRVDPSAYAVYNRFPISIGDSLDIPRDAFLAAVISEGVPAGVYYPIPFNRTTLMNRRQGGLTAHVSYPSAERACAHHILLPCYPGIPLDELNDVVRAIAKVANAIRDPTTASRVIERSGQIEAAYFGQFFTRT